MKERACWRKREAESAAGCVSRVECCKVRVRGDAADHTDPGSQAGDSALYPKHDVHGGKAPEHGFLKDDLLC